MSRRHSRIPHAPAVFDRRFAGSRLTSGCGSVANRFTVAESLPGTTRITSRSAGSATTVMHRRPLRPVPSTPIASTPV